MYREHTVSAERTSRCLRALQTSCVAALVCAAGACTPQEAKSPTQTEEMQTVTYRMPDVTSVEAGKETQERGGVTVSVVPLPFKVTDQPSKTCIPIDTSKSSSLLGGIIHVNSEDPNAKKQYQITSQAGADFEPKSLTFTIHVTNHTDHVMRLKGTVFKLNINSKEVELSETDQKKVQDTVLVPGEAKTFSIGGPDWSHNAEESTIDFGLYDLPLAVDKTGAVSDSGTFNWTYQAKLVSKTTQTKKTVQTLALSAGEATAMGCPVGPTPVTASK